MERKIEDARDVVMRESLIKEDREIRVEDPVKFLSTVEFSELPETPVATAPVALTTLNALNITRLKLANTGAVSVTTLSSGQDGQNILILGDGFTTFAVSGNIVTTTGVAKLLALNTVYSFTYLDDKWYEQNAGGSAYTGKHVTVVADGTSYAQVTGGAYEPYGVGFHTVCDATGMTQYRISGRAAAALATFSARLAYSTNGSSWTVITAVTLTFTSTPSFQATAYGALPIAAAIATAYFRIHVTTALSADTMTLSHVAVEFKP